MEERAAPGAVKKTEPAKRQRQKHWAQGPLRPVTAQRRDAGPRPEGQVKRRVGRVAGGPGLQRGVSPVLFVPWHGLTPTGTEGRPFVG